MSKQFGIIYKAINIIDGKCYIGQTIQKLQDRIDRHIYDAYVVKPENRYFQNAIRLHGIENFKWEILCECNDTLLLNIRETMKIIVNHSHWTEGGYNMTWGGESSYGYKHTDESKRKMSIASSNKHIPCSEETKKKISISNKGRISPMKGKNFSDEHKRKIGLGNKGKIRTDEQKKIYRELNTGHVQLDETKRKISQNSVNKKYPDNMVKKAIELKDKGHTIKEISEIINVPKGSICWWFKSRYKFI